MIRITKQTFLDIAEVIDSFRLVPRVLLVATGTLVWYVINWYMGLQTPTTQQAALVTTVTAVIPVVIGLYQNSSRSWDKPKSD